MRVPHLRALISHPRDTTQAPVVEVHAGPPPQHSHPLDTPLPLLAIFHALVCYASAVSRLYTLARARTVLGHVSNVAPVWRMASTLV